MRGDDSDGLLLLGADGEVLGANAWAREMLNLSLNTKAHASDVLALPWALLFDAASSDQLLDVPLWSGLQLQAKACLQHDCQTATSTQPARPLQQIQTAMISKAIEHARGNVAQAAKALGISRATLYRKLARKPAH